MLVPLVLRVHADGRIAKDGLRPRSGHGYELLRTGLAALLTGEPILEIIQRALLLCVLDFQIAHSSAKRGGPIDHILSAVHEPALICHA